MVINNRKKDMKTCQGGTSKTSRGSKAKSKSSSCKIGAEELSQMEEFGQHIGFKWGGSRARDNTNGEVPKTGRMTACTDDKVDWVRELCYKEKPDVVGIQETKLRKFDDRIMNKLWGSDDVDFVKLDAVGRSRGILMMWDTRVFNKVHVVSDHGFVAVIGKWVGVEKMVGLCIFGDFNEVKRVDEILNSKFSKKGALAFNDFMRSEELIDVSLGGKIFTRISDDGVKFSKLDRFLITDDFQEIWRNLGSVALDRKLSDHCPIILLDKGLDFGPKPFRFFDAWLKDAEMIDVVKEAWGALVSTITPDCVFRDKLKNVKHALKEWSKKKYGGLEQEINSYREKSGR
ncbi:RNA-directed DNA polymerase, eukaryota [Tanacetum coccineum]